MAETLYATFNDPNRAQTAARELVQQGVKSEEISLLVKHDEALQTPAEDSRTTTPMKDQWGNKLGDPLSNDIRQSGVARIEAGVDESVEAGASLDPAAEAERGDVAKGVAKGAGIGLGVGAVAALATLLIPGFGLVIGGGAIAAAAAALAASAATGAIAGGIVGLLKEHGVPEERAAAYDQVYRSGGAVLAVTVMRPEERPAIEATLARNGADAVEAHQAYMA